MEWGLENRLSRILQPDTARTVMLAADHGYFLGPTSKLEVPRETLAPLLPYADALMITRGVARTSIDPRLSPPLVLRISGGVSIVGADLAHETLTTTIKEAVRLNASAVAVSIFVGSEYERQSLINLSDAINEAQEYSMPVLAVTAVGREMEKRDARYLGLACRIASELGASFVKTYYCDDFNKVAESCPVPLVIAGGPKLDTMRDALVMARDAIDQGAKGVDMGRNVWQSPMPVAMIQALRAVVHENASVDKANELLETAAVPALGRD